MFIRVYIRGYLWAGIRGVFILQEIGIKNNRSWCSHTGNGTKGGYRMYTEYGYIGEDGIEYATVDEAIETGAA